MANAKSVHTHRERGVGKREEKEETDMQIYAYMHRDRHTERLSGVVLITANETW